jgi:outer membrane lipoprotein SlyB
MRFPSLRPVIGFALLAAVLTACSSGPASRPTPVPTVITKPAAPGACTTCGQVERIETLTSPARKPVGPMQGGVLGGVLSKPAVPASPQATVAPTRSFRISLKLDDGRHVAIYQTSISPNLKVGSRVRVEKGRVILLR